MKITYRRLPNPDKPGHYILAGMAFVGGKHQMTGLTLPEGAEEKQARKTIKRAFRKYRDA